MMIGESEIMEMILTKEEKDIIIECLKKDLADLEVQKSLLKSVIRKLEKDKKLERQDLSTILNSLIYDISQRVIGCYEKEINKLVELAFKISKMVRSR